MPFERLSGLWAVGGAFCGMVMVETKRRVDGTNARIGVISRSFSDGFSRGYPIQYPKSRPRERCEEMNEATKVRVQDSWECALVGKTPRIREGI